MQNQLVGVCWLDKSSVILEMVVLEVRMNICILDLFWNS